MLLVNRLVTLHEFFEIVHRQLGVELDVLLGLELGDFVLELFVLDPHRGRAEHVDDAAVAVIRKTSIARLLRQPLNTGIGQAEVENRVHHAGHRERRAGANGNEQRVCRIAELLSRECFGLGECCVDLWNGPFRDFLPLLVVSGADFRRDGETGRNRNADQTHLGEVRPLATEQAFHLAVAIRRTATEEVHKLV